MAEFKTIPIDQIVVPERLRAVEEDHALAIAQSIVEHGLLNPITVRSTRAAKGGNYTLVAGAHRLRAMVLNDESEIEAMVVEADKAEAQLLEITENLFRNELSVIDRAIFVQSYRDVWEQKYGKITRGGDHRSKDQVDPLIGSRINLVQLFEDAKDTGFSKHVANRMGLSVPSIKRLNHIAQSLSPALRTALRGTPAADNQSLLLKLAKAGPSKQAGIVAGLEKEPDIKKVLAWAKDPAPPISEADKQAIVLHQLKTAWKGADEATRQRFLQSIGLLDDVQEAAQ
ncbi:ParB/RepB/Spo0J family partition protein [Agrobacterium vitis]|uniref:ParB/RepB/Spo0J family partition protein n=1 Tax=Rhizobium/Agrobacterium group TaxID=227290 RepID=UPI0008DC221B|nr:MULTISPECIES: ParB/RepB/Spo0J family partition protein [Rhizobium/Agrobacterium group]MCF1433396.1 ParB/RepB/Spo0J family partition protein [Allorhizobium ampelinum]MUO91389.1 ParB/RepB/Spo0J family partition protein [Agrobacterium vitis]MUZ54506.1 ParB/RepB/Spo0J family partition protein [Agrobacterium vitis]MUZ93235.1 ParB/RepB/Spo0J family partition protein [Agrobacterium vitis]OHZ36178.1 chromosome partitioning protein ParB [Agrobacterium vitis]